MKRALIWSLAAVVFLMLGLATTVMLRSDSAGLPPPDPAMPIRLADGSTRPLGEVLQMLRDGVPLPPSSDPIRITYNPNAGEEVKALAESMERHLRAEENSVFQLAERARRAGRLDEAVALYLSIPEDDPRYGRARRRLAWDVLTKARGQPRLAVRYANDSVQADPFIANSWHDMARVYAATLGIDVDDWD